MKLIGIQVGKVKNVSFKTQSASSAIFKSAVAGPVRLTKLGLSGDEQADQKHHGGPDKACYAFSWGAYKNWPLFNEKALSNPGLFGENLTLDSFDETQLCIGDIFQIGECQLQVTLPRIPCSRLNMRFQNTLAVKTFSDYSRPGVYLRVLKEGKISTSDPIQTQNVEKSRMTVSEVFDVIMRKRFIPEFDSRIIKLDSMSIENKEWLIEVNQTLTKK